MSRGVTLDHVGVVGQDLGALAAQYEGLGFTLTPRAVTGDGRIENRCIMLRQGYLELMALAPGGSSATLSRMLARYTGAHIIALAVDDMASSAERLRRAGFVCSGVEFSERTIDATDPAALRAHFAHLPVPTQPEARINLIHHLTPALLWQERFLRHSNHAVALKEVVLAVAAPAESAARFSRLAGCLAVPDVEGGYALTLPRGRIRLLPPDAFAAPPPAIPSIISIRLRTDDAAKSITRLLAATAIPHIATHATVTTHPTISGGVTLIFT
jgi:hypothetical protein